MLLFIVLTWLTLVVLFVLLTRHHYQHSFGHEGKERADRLESNSVSSYFRWLLSCIPAWFRDKPWKRGMKVFQKLWVTPYSPQEKWVHIGLSLSFLYLVASGFIFAVGLFHSITGVFLVLHMILGGVFSLSLALTGLIRAKDYPVAENWPDPHEHHWETLCFWIFVLSGFVLVLTALLMMLPLWTLIGHLKTVMVHRVAALSALLSAIAFVYFKWYRVRESK